jgi:hypothetical protein
VNVGESADFDHAAPSPPAVVKLSIAPFSDPPRNESRRHGFTREGAGFPAAGGGLT